VSNKEFFSLESKPWANVDIGLATWLVETTAAPRFSFPLDRFYEVPTRRFTHRRADDAHLLNPLVCD
jgi:hypothetical protein